MIKKNCIPLIHTFSIMQNRSIIKRSYQTAKYATIQKSMQIHSKKADLYGT